MASGSSIMSNNEAAAKNLNLANLTDRTHLPVVAGYTAWAATYDSDANPLQALDSIMLQTLLPEFVNLVSPALSSAPLQLVDLGCGTGRNTAQLVAGLLSAGHYADLLAMDVTPAMLDVAAAKCNRLLEAMGDDAHRDRVRLRFRCFDMLAETSSASASAADADTISWGRADGVLSSLVIEHVPAPVFFRTCAALLRPGGFLLATNMHPDMGRATGSGYTDPTTGGKVRIEGYNHSVEEFAQEAARAGFVLQSDSVQEAAPTERMVREEQSLQLRGAKWIGVNIWMGAFWRKAGADSN